MTVIRPNSISGINSITAQVSAINFYDSAGATLSIGASVTGNITGNVTGNINSTGVSTLGNTIVGGATTQLVVNGDARITGILTVGTASVTFNGTNNTITVGTGVTIFGNTGIVSATEFRGNGANLTGVEANGALRSVQYYTSAGSATWTKPAGLKRIRVYVTGGGGGGHGRNVGNTEGGTGGAGGGTAIKLIEAASLGSTETVTVGAGGAALSNSNSAAPNGGTSSFGSHCSATGGEGGDLGGGGRYINGGSGSNGDLNTTGGAVDCSNATIDNAGSPGGNSFYGGGGRSGKTDGTYSHGAAGVLGAGGGGGGPAGGDAGNGGTGVVVVEEYF